MKYCKIPEKIELKPKKIGLKNITRVKSIVCFVFSESKPGAISFTKEGVKRKRKKLTIINKSKKIFKQFDVKRQASVLFLEKYSENNGKKATRTPPKIKTL